MYKEEWYTKEQKEEKKKNSVHFIGQKTVDFVGQQKGFTKSGALRSRRRRRKPFTPSASKSV